MATDRGEQIKAVRTLVAERYVFPDLATTIVELLDRRLADGAYAAIDDDEAFADAVTAELQSINGDKHPKLKHHPVELSPVPFDEERYAEEAALEGYGIAAVRRLDGNVGLLDLRLVEIAGKAGGALAAAATLLATTDALIIDLRRNRGGDPRAVAQRSEEHTSEAQSHCYSS